MTAPVSFREKVRFFSLAPRAPSIHDPNVWSGRAVQEVSATLADTVLHQCIRPLIGARAPGHHGYQRACDLISGPASDIGNLIDLSGPSEGVRSLARGSKAPRHVRYAPNSDRS